VAQPYGAISQADAAHLLQQPPDDLNANFCTLRFYADRRGLSTEQPSAARKCLESPVARFPTYATAWAMLTIADFDEARFRSIRDPVH
jgi:hypothetical protein